MEKSYSFVTSPCLLSTSNSFSPFTKSVPKHVFDSASPTYVCILDVHKLYNWSCKCMENMNCTHQINILFIRIFRSTKRICTWIEDGNYFLKRRILNEYEFVHVPISMWAEIALLFKHTIGKPNGGIFSTFIKKLVEFLLTFESAHDYNVINTYVFLKA